MEAIITALITGGLTLFGVIYTNNASNKRVEAQLEKAQAVTETKLEALTAEVRKHNSFGDRITVAEASIKEIQARQDRQDIRIDKIESKQ